MKIQLKSLEDQTIVITGASSGIGLATAKEAAARGARVLLVSRDTEGLERVVEEIRAEGGTVTWAEADVADAAALRNVADAAEREFGGFDTWINNAGVSIYGRIEEVPLDDAHRLFETNYWGVVNGCLAALPHLKQRGGALINVGSVVSDRAVPLQGHYSASKHAVKGFTDALRVELEKEGAPVSLTLVKPSAIDTPYTEHARNYMAEEPRVPDPVYAPEVVARAILACAERPQREVTVGAGGRMLAAMGNVAPRLSDRFMETVLFRQMKRKEAASPDRPDALDEPMPGSGRVRGDHAGPVLKHSAYTSASLHRGRALLGLAAAGTAVAFLVNRRRRASEPSAADAL